MMEHPFNVRDDACWACMIDQLSQSDGPEMPAMIEGLQAALQSPYLDRDLAAFDTNNPGIRPAIEEAWRLCRHRLECS